MSKSIIHSTAEIFQKISLVNRILLLIIFLLMPFTFPNQNTTFAATSTENEREAGSSGVLAQPLNESQGENKTEYKPYVYVTVIATPTPIHIPPSAVPQRTFTPNSSSQNVQLVKQLAGEFVINESAFMCTIQKESGFNGHYADGSIKCGDHGASCGIGQFQLGTFLSIRRHAGWSQEDLRGDDYESLKTVAYGLKNGWKYHWTAYKVCESQGYSL